MIRTAAPADLPRILEVEQLGFDPASRWSAAAWADELAGPDRHVAVAEHHAELTGVATFQLVADVADLHRVVVRPERRGQGVASELIEHGGAWASERGGRRMLLEVEPGNAAALALYGRLGFRRLARREDYYGAGRPALVMQKELG